MSRLPRRPARVRPRNHSRKAKHPPLRGRLAAASFAEQQLPSSSVIRQRPSPPPRSFQPNASQQTVPEIIPQLQTKDSQQISSESFVEVSKQDSIPTESISQKLDTPELERSTMAVSIKPWQWLLGFVLLALLLASLYS